MLREEYQGLAPPDKLADPIGYAVWFDANRCSDCGGSGAWHPKSCKELERYEGTRLPECCPACNGKGTIEEQFDPDF